MNCTEEKKMLTPDLAGMKIDDILSAFEDLNHILSLYSSITEDDYFECCYFLRCLQKNIADFEFRVRTIPLDDSDSVEE